MSKTMKMMNGRIVNGKPYPFLAPFPLRDNCFSMVSMRTDNVIKPF